ncbi:FAD-binding oxidoreductase [Weizmannia coagulans]|nr:MULTISPECIES: FAD-binding oxidoreductase [Heyndrickxia]ATW84742.1 FAD-binding oxidoreductase [Heyndrickxia coagulans]AVD57874.1 FAD-binding oxidoreductase [Heyndrickxia coagulans]MBT2196581.1 FAD-binding oxidoreductase [Heyndrickxia coagulans]MBT2238831.1 FAD-binding oxidoreductase [Heyndrickxia coagulans]MCR4446669.1 FAD-binding oxidoreductase [Heyndrickxia coagulans]
MKVVVLGAGIVGASAAYHLALKGAEVINIDKKHEGQATAAGAGIVCPWLSRVEDPAWYNMSKASACYYPTIVSLLEADDETELGYAVVGGLSVSRDIEELKEIERRIKERKKQTPEVGDITYLAPGEPQKLFPPLASDYGAVHVTGAARVDGRLMRKALLSAARKHGAIYLQEEADLLTVEGKVTGVKTKSETITADRVIAATGAWTPYLLEPLGVQLPIEPQRGQIIHISLPEEDTSKWPVVLPQTSYYLLAFNDHRVVVGATRETGSGFDYRLTARGVSEVLNAGLDVAPGLSDGTLHEIRIGFRPMAPSHIPILGFIPQYEGLVIATGLGASGLTMGPYFGKLAAELSLDHPIEDIDLQPYAPSKFLANVSK